MRILFSFVGGNGHFQPLVPVAAACAAAGHDILVTGGASMEGAVAAAGFAFTPSEPDYNDTSGALRPMLPPDPAREQRDLRDGFVLRAARARVADVTAVCARWHPDVIVCDEVDFGAMMAAEKAGLPYATIVVIAAGRFLGHPAITAALGEVRTEHGLPAEFRAALTLSPVPPRYQAADGAIPFRVHSANRLQTTRAGIYFTLGTIFNTESGDLFDRVLNGLSTLDADVTVTVGRHVDPASFGVRPPHVRIERYVPQETILPAVDVVVSHGGSGSVLGALAHGVPMVTLPIGADQPHNADRCVELGVGIRLDPVTCTPSDVRDAVSTLLTDESYRARAQQLGAEMAAMPDVATVVPLLERLRR